MLLTSSFADVGAGGGGGVSAAGSSRFNPSKDTSDTAVFKGDPPGNELNKIANIRART